MKKAVRLQKYLSMAGVASRRKSEELIRQRRVCINGKTVTAMGIRVEEMDEVSVDGKVVQLEDKKVYILLNKPCGYVTTTKEQFGRRTVLDLLSGIDARVYPVGRLDYNTSGMLILTNDGDFAQALTHPSYEKNKTYTAKIKGKMSDDDMELFEKGIMIDGYLTHPAEIKVIKEDKSCTYVEIVIHEGRNRQVRKMCEYTGHPVIELKRTSIGALGLGNLPEGEWRLLNEKEVDSLF
ncbi:MAG: pseudouridine synthase [Ignavibacteria bacterium]|jgi:23S rRNA pseudouridine2605 synthase